MTNLFRSFFGTINKEQLSDIDTDVIAIEKFINRII